MPYNYITFATARSILAARLQDPNLIYFSQPGQLDACIIESLRFYQCATGSYKQKITFQTAPNVNYYDLPSLAPDTVGYNVTDVEVINNVLACLLEPPLSASWAGTGQFTLDQFQASLQNRMNRFLGETGCRIVQTIVPGTSPPVELAVLPDTTIDVIRAAWQPVTTPPTVPPQSYPLGRLDEWAGQAYAPDAVQNPGIPSNYSTYGVAPLELRLVPPPLNEGNVDCLFVSTGPYCTLNPAKPVVLNIPDDLSPALKWGVLADVLGTDGPSRDYARAAYAEQRYQEFVQLASIYPAALTVDFNNVTGGVGSVFDMDFYEPDWQIATGFPGFLGMCGRNMACVGPMPNGVYGVGLWVCANAPVIAQNLNAAYMQIPRDQIDPVIDYAQHVASFQMGGAEFDGTTRLLENAVANVKSQNSRLSAIGFYRGQLEQPSLRSQMEKPRLYAGL